MDLKERLRADMAEAMKRGDTATRDALRLMLAAIKQSEVDEKKSLDDAAVVAVLTKQAKQRRESIADYQKAGRDDLVAQEEVELALIENYLPQQMGRDEVQALAAAIIAELGVTDAKGMGQVMSKLMPKVKGQADGRLVNDVVRELLTP
jgi:uncharacterized protein